MIDKKKLTSSKIKELKPMFIAAIVIIIALILGKGFLTLISFVK